MCVVTGQTAIILFMVYTSLVYSRICEIGYIGCDVVQTTQYNNLKVHC